jgi:hypothetical protein
MYPGWKNSYPGSGVNIPDPQHCIHVQIRIPHPLSAPVSWIHTVFDADLYSAFQSDANLEWNPCVSFLGLSACNYGCTVHGIHQCSGSGSIGSVCSWPPGSASRSVSHKYGYECGSGSLLISVERTEIMVAKQNFHTKPFLLKFYFNHQTYFYNLEL